MGKCKVREEWFKRNDPNGYLIGLWAKKAGEHDIFCIVCETNLNIDHGFCRILQHAEKKGHISNCNTKLASKQLRLTAHPKNVSDDNAAAAAPSSLNTNSSLMLTLLNNKEKAIKAELIWAMKCVLSNYSLHSNKDMQELFASMFGSCVLEDFSISSTKMMYLFTEALGPYFRKKNIEDVINASYTLCFDETTNDSGQKELQTAVRFWSKSENKIVQNHLETFFMGHATAEELCQKLLSSLTNANLPLKDLLMISCDGPNVNKKVIRLMNEHVLEVRKKSLIDIGTCSLHKIHNAFQKGLEEMENDVSQLIISLYYYFDGWPARWEDFSKLQKETGVPKHRFIKHVTSRWLTLSPAALRILEQWKAIIKYFTKFVPLHASSQMKSGQYQVIVKLLKMPDIKVQIIFAVESSNFFSAYLKIFQKEEPMVHRLYEEEMDLSLKLKGRVYKMDNVENIADVEEELELLPVTEIQFSEEMSKELKMMKEKDKKNFLYTVQRFYITSYTYLRRHLDCSSDNVLSHLRCLQPGKYRLASSEPQIVALGKAVPFDVDVCRLLDEWKILKFEEMPANMESYSIDKYWLHILEIKTATKELKYPILREVVKAVLSLSHGSASVERGFSASGNLLTPDKASMNVRGLNARLNILSGLKKYNNKPFLVPITKELLLLGANAHQSYKNYLQMEKEKEEMQKIKEAEKRRNFKEKSEAATELKNLSNSLLIKKNEEERKKKAADKLLDEATERLESAIKRKNFDEIVLAQGMLHGVKKLRTSETEATTELCKIAKRIEKKTYDINSYFKKLSKN